MPGFALSMSTFALQTLRSLLPVAAQLQPSSCNIPQGSGGSSVQVLRGQSSEQAARFGRSSLVSLVEFPVASLVRTEEIQFLQSSFVPPRC